VVLLDLPVSLILVLATIFIDGSHRIYNGVAFLGMLFTYFPKRLHNVDRGSKMATLKQIDYIGAFLSITGITLL
jgi:hypothetical protein